MLTALAGATNDMSIPCAATDYYVQKYIHPSIVPWVHHPLVSNARLTIIFNAPLSCAFLFSMNISSLHHSFTSSSHSLFGRPLFVFSFISPTTTSYTSLLLSSILQMCPNKFKLDTSVEWKNYIITLRN